MYSKTKALILLSFFILSISCSKNEPGTTNPPSTSDGPFAVDIGDSEIPYIVINTNGTAIENEPKVSADMKIYIEEEEVQSQSIGIEFRGSTSFRLSDKKSYGIETWDASGNDIDVSFFGFPAEEDWVLIGHVVNVEEEFYFDRTLLYHHFAYHTFRKMGRYASRSKLVELEINREYLGIYMFMEKLKRDNERIDIKKLTPDDNSPEDITGGYILKIDKTSGGDRNLEGLPLSYFENNWDDDARYTPENSFRSEYDVFGLPLAISPFREPYHSDQYLETYFLYEYPKPHIITNEQKNYIQQYIYDFETALLVDDFSNSDRTYTEYIDIASFVDFFIINELCKNIDGYRLSTYMYKDRGEKLKMGPVWDFNIGFDSNDRVPSNDWVVNYNNYVSIDAWMMPFWWPRLLEDPIFKQAIKERWNELRNTVFRTEELLGDIDQDVSSLTTNRAIERNQIKWGIYDYNESIESLKSYLRYRTTWMDSEIDQF